MNMKLNSIFGLITLFPIWAFRGNLNYLELFLTLVIFFAVPFLVHFYLCFFYKKKNDSYDLHTVIHFSLLTVFCLDQNLGLWTTSIKFKETITSIFNIQHANEYLFALIFLLISFLFFTTIFRILKRNGFFIIFIFMLTITSFNLFDYRKNLSSFPSIDNRFKHDISVSTTNKSKKNLVIILDEMSGINSHDSNHFSGKIVREDLKTFFKNNDFEIHVNAKTLYNGTKNSIPTILNYITNNTEYQNLKKPENSNYKLLKNSDNYFIVHELVKNKFFDNAEFNKISVFQSMFIDYCNHKKVIKCNQYNPFNKEQTFLTGFRNSYLTLIISAIKNNGSITGKFFWRVIRHYNLADSLLEPEGEKASFEHILNKIFFSIYSDKTDLIFAHILVPHVPYGFDDNCNYEGHRGVRYNSMTVDEKRIQHNLERGCIINFFDIFFKKLKNKKIWKNIEITILSDHDSRISSLDVPHTAIIFHKFLGKKGKLNYDSKTTNQIFKKLFYNPK